MLLKKTDVLLWSRSAPKELLVPMEPGDKLLRSTACGDELLGSGDELLRSCGDELRGSRSRGCSCAGAAESTAPVFVFAMLCSAVRITLVGMICIRQAMSSNT